MKRGDAAEQQRGNAAAVRLNGPLHDVVAKVDDAVTSSASPGRCSTLSTPDMVRRTAPATSSYFGRGQCRRLAQRYCRRTTV